MVGAYKAKIVEEGLVAGPPRLTVAVTGVGEGERTSISQAGPSRGVALSRPSSRLPTILECEDAKGALEDQEKALILLPVRSRPGLAAPYDVIFEMRTLLQLRSLHLSNFHVTEKGDWGFVVSGCRDSMGGWVLETRQMTTVRMNLKPKGRHPTLVLLLGIVIGAIAVLWVLPSNDHRDVCTILFSCRRSMLTIFQNQG